MTCRESYERSRWEVAGWGLNLAFKQVCSIFCAEAVYRGTAGGQCCLPKLLQTAVGRGKGIEERCEASNANPIPKPAEG